MLNSNEYLFKCFDKFWHKITRHFGKILGIARPKKDSELTNQR